MERSNFQQLEQDRQARFPAQRPTGNFRESAGGRFAR
jgi:hypothetical protein